jgi:hypothetical protein
MKWLVQEGICDGLILVRRRMKKGFRAINGKKNVLLLEHKKQSLTSLIEHLAVP